MDLSFSQPLIREGWQPSLAFFILPLISEFWTLFRWIYDLEKAIGCAMGGPFMKFAVKKRCPEDRSEKETV